MANASYDTLTIQINADSKEANRSIATLNRNLNNLDETAKKLNTRRIGEVKGLLLNIAKIDFSNVSKGLQDVVSAFKYFNLNRSAKADSFFPVLSSKNYEKELKSYTKIAQRADFSFGGMANNDTTTKLSSQVASAKEIREVLKDIELTGTQINKVLGILGVRVNSFSDEKLTQMGEALKSIGVSSEKIDKVMKELVKDTKEMAENTNHASRGFAKMFKNILKYRVVRRLIQSIFQEVSNAIESLANIDEDFNKSLGEIKSAISYVARVLVSLIAPIVKIIAPIVVMIAEAIGFIGNVLGQSIAGALGQEDFAEATESVETYTDSLKKAKNVSMGFDKLNVISKDNADGFKMTDITKGSGALGEVIGKIREVLQPILQEIVPQVSALLSKIIASFDKIRPALEIIIDLIADFINYTDDSAFGGVNALVDNLITTTYLLATITKLLSPILKILNAISIVITNIIDWVVMFISNVVSTFVDYIATIFETIIAFVSGDFDQIGMLWDNLLNNLGVRWQVFGMTIANFFIKVWNNIVDFIENIINSMIGGLNKIGEYTGGWSIPEVDFSGAKGQTYDVAGAVSGGNAFNYDISSPSESMGGNSKSGDVVIEIDGREIARAVNTQNANSGSQMMWGGDINYGK